MRYNQTDRILTIVELCQVARLNFQDIQTELSRLNIACNPRTLRRDIQYLESRMILFSESTQSGRRYRLNPAKNGFASR